MDGGKSGKNVRPVPAAVYYPTQAGCKRGGWYRAVMLLIQKSVCHQQFQQSLKDEYRAIASY